MSYGVTPEGFIPKTMAIVVGELEDFQRGNIDPTWDLDADQPTGQMNSIVANQIAEVWEALEDTFNGLNPNDAEGVQLTNIGKVTNTPRAGAENSEVWMVIATVPSSPIYDLISGESFVENSNESGQLWTPVENTTIDWAVDPSKVVRFISVNEGAVSALAGEITVLNNMPAEVETASNPYAASVGSLGQTESEHRETLKATQGVVGLSTEQAVISAVSRVHGISDVSVYVNPTNALARGVNARAMKVTILDGNPSLADDDEVAQAIFDNMGRTVSTDGSSSGTATDGAVAPIEVKFQRLGNFNAFFNVSLAVTPDFVGDDAALAAMLGTTFEPGEDVFASRFVQQLMGVTGVVDCTVFVGSSFGTATSNRAVVGSGQKAVVLEANISIESGLWSDL